MEMLSMIATCRSHGQDSSYFLGWQEYQKNPHNELYNPSGIIQMGLAENQLSFDLLESWLARNPEATMFPNNINNDGGISMFREMALFQDYHGFQVFKNELVEFMSEIRQNKVRFDPKNLVLTAGATSANETLMFCLAEPGEAFLIPIPYYPGFDRDLKWRTGVEIVPVHCSSSNGFRITNSALEKAYEQARNLNLKVKGVFITNPSNPLGTTMNRAELNILIRFALAKKIHIVSDEIYGGTVFHPNKFTSIVQAVMDLNLENTEIWTRIHIVSSLSKDLGLPGFRVGMIYSNNQTLIAAATKMSSFGLVSSQTQYLLSKLLGDKKFTKKYIRENRKRLEKRQKTLVRGLKEVGIECLKSNAGLYCWVDMRNLLPSTACNNTFEGEIELWKKILYQVGLNISPGSSCHCSEPGWFRVCFANMSEETLKLSIQRMKGFVNSISIGGDLHGKLYRN